MKNNKLLSYIKKSTILGITAFTLVGALTFTNVSFAKSKNTTTASISLATAKKTALEDAKLSSSDVTFTKVKLDHADYDYDHDDDYDDDDYDDYDDVSIYDIEFTTSTKKYEYEIDANTNEILEKSVKKLKVKKAPVTKEAGIGSTAAKNAALTHAELKANEVTFTKVKLTRDDGVSIYDIEFTCDYTEYEYEISSKTGKILDFSIEEIDD